MYEKIYTQITDALVENGYIVIENALGLDLVEKLSLSLDNEAIFKKAGISSKGALHIDSTKRSDKILWLNEDAAAQSEFLSFTKGLQEYLIALYT